MTAKQSALKKYVVNLSDAERERLNALISKGKHPARLLLRARILLKADASGGGDACSDSRIAAALDTSVDTVARTRQQLVEEGFEFRAGPQAVAERRQAAHFRWRRRSQADRAGLFATAQGTCAVDLAAAGRTRRAIEDRRAGVGQYDRANAQKNTLKPHLQQQWVIPPEANAAFVAGMEDVLEVYHRPHDPERPLVCLDETSKQLVAETRVPIPARAARPKRVDYEYARNSLPLRRR